MREGTIEAEIARRLSERSETLVVVETSAGGLAASRLTAIPGSSAWFAGGLVAYSAGARLVWLGVSQETTSGAGAVSAEAALALARAGRESLGALWGAAETGIAGPQVGRRSSKPAGLGYVAVVGLANGRPIERVEEVVTGLGERVGNQKAFANALLRLLLRVVEQS